MYLKNWFIQTAKDVLIRLPKRTIRGGRYISQFLQFKKLADNRFSIYKKDIYPCLSDSIKLTPFDHHYTYHPAWAARILSNTRPSFHTDFSSILHFSTILSAFIPVRFYDYRPAELHLSNWQGGFADLCNIPLESNSLPSISCMHTIEHIGLGRYGDPIDPNGDITAVKELIRVTEKDGDILFATPVGKPRIEFNAHRVYSYELIMEMFTGCRLMNFSLIPDAGGIIENADPSIVKNQHYGCGCFWFKKN